jgi:L,D-transpeptidase catalytic domain
VPVSSLNEKAAIFFDVRAARVKYFTVAAAVLLLVGFALIVPAQVRGGVSADAAPTATSPGNGTQPVAMPPHIGSPSAAKAPSGLSPIDHAVWIATRPSDRPPNPVADSANAATPKSATAPSGPMHLSPIDHVLIIRPEPAAGAKSVEAAPEEVSGPAARATPAAAATPTAGQAASGEMPSARPQPVAKLTPGLSAVTAARAPATAPAGLSPIDHTLWVSVHPPSAPPPSSDHSVPETDHKASGNWILTPGQELLASLNLPLGQHLTEGEVLLDQTRDDSFLDPINWSVIVHKSAYLLDVYYKGRLFGSFPAVFGRNPDHSAKMWEGDLRTPEGVYTIIEKYRNPRWRWFLRLNYPNSHDRSRYDTMLDEGLVPVLHGHYRRLGGAIGIHGTDRPRFNRLDLNWTLGCISLQNNAIDELARILPVGTMVLIKGN